MFDAGSIVAHLDIDPHEFDRKLDERDRRVKDFERERHEVKLSAVFDNASTARAAKAFADLDNKISRDAAQRLRSSPQGSVLGALNALFSPHPISGGPSAMQSASQGGLGQTVRQVTENTIPGGNTSGTTTEKVTQAAQDAAVRRSLLSKGSGGSSGGFFSRLAGGIGPNILGLGTKATLGIAGGGSLLGALPALLGPLAALGVGGLGIGAGAKILGSALSANNITQYVSQYQAAQNALQAATTPQQRIAAQRQMATATQGARQIAGPAGFQAFNALNSLQNSWQNFTAGFLPSAAKILNSVSGLFTKIMPLLQTFFSAGVRLLQPFIASLGDLAKQILPSLATAFKLVAPFIRPLIDGLGMLVGSVIKGLLPALKAVGPIIKPFGQILGTLGRDVGLLFANLAPAFKQSVPILKALFSVIGSILPLVANLAVIFAKALAPAFVAFAKVIQALEPTLTLIGKVLAALSAAIIGDLVSAFTALATLIKDLAPSFAIVAKTLESVFKILENSGVFGVLGSALEQLAPKLAGLINALVVGLAPALPELLKALSELVTVLAGGLGAALGALLIAATPIVSVLAKITAGTVEILGKAGPLLPFLLGLVVAMKAWGLVNAILIGGMRLLGVTAGLTAEQLGKLTLVEKLQALWEGIVSVATKAWAAVQVVLDAVLSVNPIFLIIAAIIALGVGIYELVRHWSTVWGWIKRISSDFWHWLDNNFIQPLVNFFTKTIPTSGRLLRDALELIWSDMEIDALKLIAAILSGFSHIPFIGHYFTSARNAIETELGRLEASNAATVQRIQDDWNKLHGKSVALTFGLNLPAGVSYPSRQIKGRGATGVRGAAAGMWVVGENGPEVAYLPQGTNVIPAGPSRKILGGLAAGTSGWNIFGSYAPPVGQFLSGYNRMFSTAEQAVIAAVQARAAYAGGGLGAGGSGVARWASVALAVLKMLGQPASDLGVVLAQMTTESGGNPFVVNKWDSNWRAGIPSVGLMQVIGPTFGTYAGPFRNTGPFEYGVSVNPLANIFAGLNYAIHAYPGHWTSVLGHGHGYDNGGWMEPGLSWNHTGKREAVLTPSESTAFKEVAAAASRSRRGGGGGGPLLRDVHLMMPEGSTVAAAMNEVTFQLQLAAQRSSYGAS